MNLFFTADEHYGHRNIIDYCKRPFANVDDMREGLITRHNKKVPAGNNSLTVHVGDMFWRTMPYEECINIMKRLNGHHAFVYGNHDELFQHDDKYEDGVRERHPQATELRRRFDWIRDVKLVKEGVFRFWVSHYAHRAWPGSHKTTWHVYGHTHNILPDFRRSHDVGVDANNYEPVSLEELKHRFDSMVLEPDIIEKEMIRNPWPKDHLPEGSH